MWYSTLLLALFACVCAAHSDPTSYIARSSAVSSASESESGSTGDVYNVCPVIIDFNGEQEDLSDDELKAKAADAAMSAYLVSHPNNTLWDYFKIERKHKREVYKNLPLKERIKKVVKGVVDFTADTIIHLAQNIASAIKWIVNVIRDPLVGAKQVANFFKEFGNNCKDLWKLFKDDPKETGENVAGGLLLHIVHHPAEFTAETVLMVGGGFAVIHGLIHGTEAIFGAMSNVISKVLLSVLMFIHAIDDPIYIVTPLVTSIIENAATLAANGTREETTLTTDTIQPLKQCKIPVEYRPAFSSHDLCLSSPASVRQLIFGSTKRSAKMTKEERIEAYNHFHDFVCCFLQNQEFEVNAPKLDNSEFEPELVATPVKMSNCSVLLADYSDDTVWVAPSRENATTSLEASSEGGSDEV